jgi:hypothetical protein
MRKFVYLSILSFLLLLNLKTAFAEESAEWGLSSSKYWISTGFLSYHTNRKAGYNEKNTGVGFEYQLNEESGLALGHYRNSVRRQTTYVQYVYTPFRIGNVRIGGAVGLVNGYPLLRDGKFAPALLPVVSTTFKVFDRNVGFNTVYIPSIVPNVDGALAFQFKFALD